MSGTIKFVKREDKGAGNFLYTYDCTCIPKKVKTIEVTSGNDNEAKQLAQQECDDYCDT